MTSGEDPALGLSPGMVRKLAAILSADVEGYSRLMGEDEAATLHTLKAYRTVIDTLLQQHRGRVVDSPGDNLLAEFSSVVDAMQCAVAIQRELNISNTALPLQRRMKFRVGINLGDVIVDGERIYGDGVNIAARLESLAEGGGICISGSVYEQIRTKLALGYEDLGAQAFKNIAEPVRVYRVRTEPGVAVPQGSQRKPRAATSRRRRALIAVALFTLLGGGVSVWQLVSHRSSPLPDRASIAVLPFVNMSGDPEQEYFSDGMTEDLITELSRLAGLLVIARNSVLPYKGKTVKPEQVSRELGVRYMIEGSVRKANNRVRVTAQLVDVTTGYHVWAQNYDRDLQDIFAVQEEIARMITRALAVRLTKTEEKHMGRPYTSSEVAWEYFIRGAELYRRFTPQDNAQARGFFEKAITLDPEFARAYANLAATHRQDGSMRWTQDRQISEGLAYSFAQKAVELARRELGPQAFIAPCSSTMGLGLMYRRQHQEALAAAEEAVKLSPSYADGYALAAQVLIYSGKPEEALGKIQQAITHNPKYPFFYDYHRGHAHYVWGLLPEQDSDARRRHFEEAETHLREAIKKNSNFKPARAYLVAVLSELGRQQEAVSEMAIIQRLAGLDAQDHQAILPYSNQAIATRLVELWKRAAP